MSCIYCCIAIFLTTRSAQPSKRTFKNDQSIPQHVFGILKQLPAEAHPMEWFYTGITVLGMTTQTGDWMEDALNVIARMPELVAAVFRLRSGWGEPIAPKAGLGLIENFVHMLDVPDVQTQSI